MQRAQLVLTNVGFAPMLNHDHSCEDCYNRAATRMDQCLDAVRLVIP